MILSEKELKSINIKKDHSKTLLIGGNFAILLWIVLGAISFWFFEPLFGWMFLLFGLFVAFLVYRRLGCSSCAYCSSCTMGFGKLSALFFGRRELKSLNEGYGMVSILFFYFLFAVFPFLALTSEIIQIYSLSKILVLFSLFTITLYSAITWRLS